MSGRLGATRTVHLSLDVLVHAPVEAVFWGFADWAAQGQWMLGTRVEVTGGGSGHGEGETLAAWTGVGPVGFWDTMVITRWEAPHRVDVLHTGRIVRGTGTMEAVELPHGRSRFVWSEDLELPLGTLGAIGWPIVKPAFVAGVRRSLRSFGRLVEQGVLPTGR